jgi:hypothetical protein
MAEDREDLSELDDSCGLPAPGTGNVVTETFYNY